MELMFKWQEIGKRHKGLTYDDVLLVPSFSEVRSRRDPVLETQLTKTRKIRVPLISANMDTITEAPMAIAMGELGGMGIIHRFMSKRVFSFGSNGAYEFSQNHTRHRRTNT